MDTLHTVASAFGVKETVDRLAAALGERGVTVFARIDHARGAADAGMQLRPTEVLVFGNPRAGTPLMQHDQRVGLDLPLKVLVWQDEAGRVWLTYDEPRRLAERYGLTQDDSTLAKMGEALNMLVGIAGGRDSPR
jgi:uncharacterized protein (DUF302 family)